MLNFNNTVSNLQILIDERSHGYSNQMDDLDEEYKLISEELEKTLEKATECSLEISNAQEYLNFRKWFQANRLRLTNLLTQFN
jgi:hypothetical protein